MEVSCRFLCFLCLSVVVAWRLLIDAVFMEVPCRFHGGRCFFYLHLLVLSCTLTDARSMFHGGSSFQGVVMEVTHKLNQQNQQPT